MRTRGGVLPALGLLLAACGMRDQARVEPLEPSAHFADGRGARSPPPGTVPRGALAPEHAPGESPWPYTLAFLERGRERYDVFCAPCHDRVGTGRGPVVLRGLVAPESFHTERLRAMPDAEIADVAANGRGTMAPMRGQVPLRDRWAIVGYVRALQRSRAGTAEDVPRDELRRLREAQR